MRKRYSSILVLIVLLLLSAFAAWSEAGGIVALKSARIKPYDDAVEGFRSSFGNDVTEVVMTEAEPDEVMRKLHTSGAEAIFAVGMDALNLARSASDIPVIYAMVPHAPTNNSNSKPISGVSMSISPDRYISSMLDVFDGAKRIGVIYDPKNSEPYIKDALQSAQTRGVELVLKKASKPSEIPAIIDSLKNRIDVFWMLPDATVISPETVKYLLLFSFQNKVPVFTFSRKYVEIGSAAGLYASPFDMGVQAGEMARKIVTEKNRKAIRADARKTSLAINGKIMRKLGMKVRPGLMDRVENVD